MDILLCTDGSESSIKSAEMIGMLQFPGTAVITILGVNENSEDLEKISTSMNQIEAKLSSNYQLKKKIRSGNPIDEILGEVNEKNYNLVVVGGGGSSIELFQPQLGSTTRKLARKFHTHFLVVRNLPAKINKILVCTGGEAPSSEMMTLGGDWISKAGARVNILHVIQAGKETLTGSATLGEPSASSTAKSGQTHDAVFSRAEQQLRDAGVKNEIKLLVRKGLIVDEVIKELVEGGYDLMLVGAHYLPGKDRWKSTLFDDITDQLLNRTSCSVLII